MKLTDLPIHLQNKIRRKPSKKKKRPEQGLQIAIFNFLCPLMIAQKYEQFIAFHVPNGGWRTPFEANLFKTMGVMPGVADIILLFPPDQTASLGDGMRIAASARPPRVVFVELKFDADQVNTQQAFQIRVEAMGFKYILLQAKTPDDAVRQTKQILENHGVAMKAYGAFRARSEKAKDL